MKNNTNIRKAIVLTLIGLTMVGVGNYVQRTWNETVKEAPSTATVAAQNAETSDRELQKEKDLLAHDALEIRSLFESLAVDIREVVRLANAGDPAAFALFRSTVQPKLESLKVKYADFRSRYIKIVGHNSRIDELDGYIEKIEAGITLMDNIATQAGY